MTDIIMTIRLSIDGTSSANKKFIFKLSKWLNQYHEEHSYTKYAQTLIENVLASVQLPFDSVAGTEITNSERNEYLNDLRHPRMDKNQKWTLDDIGLKNKDIVFVKLEKQWIKGIVKIKGKSAKVVIEPENVTIPMREGLFLRW